MEILIKLVFLIVALTCFSCGFLLLAPIITFVFGIFLVLVGIVFVRILFE